MKENNMDISNINLSKIIELEIFEHKLNVKNYFFKLGFIKKGKIVNEICNFIKLKEGSETELEEFDNYELEKNLTSLVKQFEEISLNEIVDKIIDCNFLKKKLYYPKSVTLLHNDLMNRCFIVNHTLEVCYDKYQLCSNNINTLLKNHKEKNYVYFFEEFQNTKKKIEEEILINVSSFFIYILNKNDPNNYYVFPLLFKNQNGLKLLYSKIQKNIGGNINNDESFIDETISNIKSKLTNMSVEPPSTKYVYSLDDVVRFQTLLENSKINDLIQNKTLSLNDKFIKITNKILKESNSNDSNLNISNSSEETVKKYFSNLFVNKDKKEDNKEKIEELYKAYKNEPDKENFINFIIDKMTHQKFLRKKEDTDTNNNISVVDDIFKTISETNFDGNTFNLTNTDAKLILMLETLENTKKTFKENKKENLTVNINKEASLLKINDQIISFE